MPAHDEHGVRNTHLSRITQLATVSPAELRHDRANPVPRAPIPPRVLASVKDVANFAGPVVSRETTLACLPGADAPPVSQGSGADGPVAEGRHRIGPSATDVAVGGCAKPCRTQLSADSAGNSWASGDG